MEHEVEMREDGKFQLPALSVMRLHIRYRILEAGDLPTRWGGLLRGTFGKVLRDLCCTASHTVCDRCGQRRICAYDYMFHSPPTSEHVHFSRYRRYPHPYLFEPFPIPKRFSRGDTLKCNLMLLGNGIIFLPFIISALMELGKTGLGRNRLHLQLETVTDGGTNPPELIFDARRNQIVKNPELIRLNLFRPEAASLASIRFVTPVRIRRQNEIVKTPDFTLLIQSILRRIAMLNEVHGQEAWDPEIGRYTERCAGVTTQSKYFHWQNWSRFSRRKHVKIYMGGFTGEMVISGPELPLFIPVLRAAELIHIGRGTVFGNGKLELRVVK